MSVTGAVSQKGRYKQCLAAGAYEVVSPGEVCTIETAKRLGIYDPKEYFLPDGLYASLQTFRPETDQKRAAGTPGGAPPSEEVCSVPATGAAAYPYCSIEHGVGMVRKASSPGTCATYGCPTGFAYDAARQACTKPRQDAVLTQRAFCDERWYDWYMVPNYHLGNRYQPGSNVGECYQPCNPGFVPSSATDPGDGSSLDLFSKDEPGKCVPKDEFFFGKYRGTSDYCPLAWIHRMGVLPSGIADTLSNVYASAAAEGVPNARLDTLMNERFRLADKLGKLSGSFLENVETPTAAMRATCSAPGYRTEERLRTAYGVCQDLKTDEEGFARRLGAELGLGADAQSNRIVLLKQACNAVFCNGDDDSLGVIGSPDPICFEGVSKVVGPVGDETPPDPPSIDPGLGLIGRVAKGSVRAMKQLAIAALVIIGLMLLVWLVRWLWDRPGFSLRKVYDAIRRLFGGQVIGPSDNLRQMIDVVEEEIKQLLDQKKLIQAARAAPA